MKLLYLHLALATAGYPQSPIEFDVASIKPNKSGFGGMGIHNTHGLWRAENISVRNLLINAYDILPEQIAGAPAWLEAERFDIEGRFEVTPESEKAGASGQRLQALLASRFQFRTHRETKEWQANVLVVARKGSMLKPSTEEKMSMTSNNGRMDVKAGTLDNLARNLAFRLGRPVVNQTGLDGKFDFILEFEPEGQQGSIADSNNPIAGIDARKPSLFTALQDQLGLKLESRKAPVELLVIDRIERPTEN